MVELVQEVTMEMEELVDILNLQYSFLLVLIMLQQVRKECMVLMVGIIKEVLAVKVFVT